MSIGKKIKQLREQRKLSQKELADSLGVTQQAIDAWERSITNPRKRVLINYLHFSMLVEDFSLKMICKIKFLPLKQLLIKEKK